MAKEFIGLFNFSYHNFVRGFAAFLRPKIVLLEFDAAGALFLGLNAAGVDVLLVLVGIAVHFLMIKPLILLLIDKYLPSSRPIIDVDPLAVISVARVGHLGAVEVAGLQVIFDVYFIREHR